MRGGYRKGAGRKIGYAAVRAEEARRVFAEEVAKEILPIANALVRKAKRGDVSAARELLDRAWGRSPQAILTQDVTPQFHDLSADSPVSDKEMREFMAQLPTHILEQMAYPETSLVESALQTPVYESTSST